MASTKKGFKEKVIQLYEALFSKEPMELLSSKPDYWDEFFLLKPNKSALDSCVKEALKKEPLLKTQHTINLLFSQCIVALKEENNIRIANALLTLCCLSRMVLHQKKSSSYDGADVLIGRQDIELKFEILRSRLCELLYVESPSGMKALILEFLLIITTSHQTLAENPLVDYLMSEHLFDAFMSLISTSQYLHVVGYQTVLLLTLLVNYKQKKTVNPYVVKLSISHKEVALNGYAQVISQALQDFSKQYDEKTEEPKSGGGLLSSITSLVGHMFVAEDDNGLLSQPKPTIRPSYSVLLAFYEAVHLNRNFITLLTNCPADYNSDEGVVQSLDEQVKVQALQNFGSPPSNLLVTFIEFCSIAMVNTRCDEQTSKTSRLCFILLTCIAEDPHSNAIIHDPNLAFRVQLRRTPMRHRKIVDDTTKPSRPLFCSVLDLMVEFTLSNLRKTLPLELHMMALGVIHRILCYQKKCGIRLSYPWTDLWSAIITLLKFLIGHESELLKKMNIFSLMTYACNIFNLFITFGDTFLPSAQAYDQLYYEIIRMHIVFENLYLLALRHSSSDGAKYKESSIKTVSSLANIKAIINHFSPKIDTWSERNQIESITEEDVLEVVRDNYDSLTLKLQEGLDSYEVYSVESPSEATFFREILESVIGEYRENEEFSERDVSLEHQTLIKEIMESNQSIDD